MSRNVSDVYSKLPGSVAVSGAVIDSSDYNDQLDDIVNALNDVAMLSGSKPFTGNQSMGSNKLTSVTDGTAAQDAATLKQVQNAVVQHSTAVAGTADAIQVTLSPASTSLTTNEVIRWKSGGANTVTGPTLSKDGGSTNKTIKKGASAALAVGDTGASGYECEAIYNGTDWILQNPATDAATSANITAIAAGKKAIWIDASAMRPKATNGAGFSDYDSGASDVTLRCADFDTTTQEYAHFKMAMPEIWNEGTVTFKPYWTNTAGLTTETVVFSLAGLAIGNDDAINAAMGTAQTSSDTWLAQNDLHVGPESSAITIAGTPAAGDLVVFEVSRVVASDNMTGDARLIGLMLYVTTNAFNEA
jgi:hypothetical protein